MCIVYTYLVSFEGKNTSLCQCGDRRKFLSREISGASEHSPVVFSVVSITCFISYLVISLLVSKTYRCILQGSRKSIRCFSSVLNMLTVYDETKYHYHPYLTLTFFLNSLSFFLNLK